MISFRNTNKGLLKMIFVILIILLILAYFGFNLRTIVASQTFQDNWNFLTGLAVNLWNNILKGPVTWLWDNLLAPLASKTATQLDQQHLQQELASSTANMR